MSDFEFGAPRNPARRGEYHFGTGPERVRKLLTRTWYPFLGRFPQPTRIQQEAIPLVLAGQPVLLASATATGKTEAYTAPLVERLLREKWSGGASLLIVSPTRALVNDLFRRLEAPMRALGVPLGRKTGDYSEIALTSAEKDAGDKAAVLITTPESLDSMLARRPETLKSVRAIVLDELHVLDGSARGDQLAILVARLERLVMGVAANAAVRGGAVPLPLQRVAATATAARTDDVARRYLGPRAVVVATDERREIEADLIASAAPESILAYFRGLVAPDGTVVSERTRMQGRKILVFTNSRAEAENYAVACAGHAPFGRDVFVHHASLARQERERVESRFLAASTALCFATTTLELGIDIGDIDRVGLVGPPPDVPALLQRVGRGNRRSWDVTRVACFYETPAQRARFEHLLECARRGEIHAGPVVFRPSVLVQQAYSLLYQNRSRWVDAKSLHERLPSWVAGQYTVEQIEELLVHLSEEEWLAAMPGRRFGPADRLERMYVRGLMHGNIASRDDGDLEVVDATTERVLGYVSAPVQGDMPRRGRRGRQAARDLAISNLPNEIVLGGRKRQVQKISGSQIRVASGGPVGKAQFSGSGSPSIPLGLAQSFAAWLGIEERHVKIVVRDEVLYIGHFLGSAYGRLMLECLKTSVKGLTAAGNGFVCALATVVAPDLNFRESQVLGAIGKHRRALSSALSDGPMSGRLPSEWWTKWLQDSLDVPQFLTIVDTMRADEDVSPQLADIIVSLSPRHQHG